MQTDSLLSNHDLEQLRLQAAALLRRPLPGSSNLSGEQASLQRGMGMELEDLRPYQVGDDVRHIAWRTTARSSRPITKVFRAERLQRILLIIEQHPGMGFATRGELKATQAAKTAALIAFAGLHQRAEVGALVCGQTSDQTIAHFPYSNQLDATLTIIGSSAHPPEQHSDIVAAQALLQAQRISRRGDTIFIISDFGHWHSELASQLRALTETRPVHALQIIDDGERRLTDVGRLRLRSPFDGSETIIDTGNAELRKQYAMAMTQKQQQLQQLFQLSHVAHHTLRTDADAPTRLAAIL